MLTLHQHGAELLANPYGISGHALANVAKEPMLASIYAIGGNHFFKTKPAENIKKIFSCVRNEKT